MRYQLPKLPKISILFFLYLLAAPLYGQEEAPTWEALRARPYPQWFEDAKLGVFIHWGIYSVPAYSGKEQYAEWFLRGLQTGDTLRTNFMDRVYGEDFEYRDFAPMFKAELFDPAEWAGLFHRAGARYVLLVSKHHDGYCLWPSEYAEGWNSMDVGPRRDLVGELTNAVRAEGLRMGLYYSLAEWNNPLYSWYNDPEEKVHRYVDEYMIPQFKELIGTYEPSVLFTDGEWSHPAETWRARELISWYYDTVGPEAIVNNRWGHGSDIGFLTPEYSAGLEVKERPWAEVRGLGRSFALNRNESLDAYMTPEELVHFFAKAVAHGGGVIINVGPKADGQIPLLQQERLIQLGEWLEINGEAIYGSEAWKKPAEQRPVTMERVDPAIDFNWVRNTPGRPILEDNFSATWTGFIQPRYSEEYLFEAEADDYVRVYVNGELVVDKWDRESSGPESNVMESETGGSAGGRIRLEAGRKYPIQVEYREETQNAHVRLFWSSDSRPREIVPQSRLFSEVGQTKADGLLGVYASLQPYLVYTVNNDNLYAISLEWPGDTLTLSPGLEQAPYRVSLLGREGELPWRYENGELHIDLSELGYAEVPGKYAWVFRIE